MVGGLGVGARWIGESVIWSCEQFTLFYSRLSLHLLQLAEKTKKQSRHCWSDTGDLFLSSCTASNHKFYFCTGTNALLDALAFNPSKISHSNCLIAFGFKQIWGRVSQLAAWLITITRSISRNQIFCLFVYKFISL